MCFLVKFSVSVNLSIHYMWPMYIFGGFIITARSTSEKILSDIVFFLLLLTSCRVSSAWKIPSCSDSTSQNYWYTWQHIGWSWGTVCQSICACADKDCQYAIYCFPLPLYEYGCYKIVSVELPCYQFDSSVSDLVWSIWAMLLNDDPFLLLWFALNFVTDQWYCDRYPLVKEPPNYGLKRKRNF